MPNPPWQRLPRDELVVIIGSYYKFLTKFYIPSEALKFPPPGGWPNITSETTKRFPRSPIVVDLIKHLPYIDAKYSRNMVTHIHCQCDVVDYSTVEPSEWDHEDFQSGAGTIEQWIGEMKQSKKNHHIYDNDEEGYLWYQDEERDKHLDKQENWWDGDDPEDIKLENMIVLANGYESGGRTLVLDVFKGNIYEDILRCNMLSEVEVEDFFSKFEELKYVPVPGGYKEPGKSLAEGELYTDVLDVDQFDEALLGGDPAQQYKKIYQNFGWPGDAYRKGDAIAAIQAHHQRRIDAYERKCQSVKDPA
jgi:hypothetical protein